MAEHFTEPDANVIVSDQGFSITVLGRTGMRYTEGGRSVRVNSEVLAKPRAIAFVTSSIRRWEGGASEDITEAERVRIADNIERAFLACGYEPERHEPFDWNDIGMRPPSERHRRPAADEG